ncbi:GNAT family N-acetyltransferase [Bacillus velezensis]|nr:MULTISPECIES: GNAT family N-acetyltransferase [Bacillus amyloliquefaciens group]APH37828.1 GNAT family N-acetyltransferase [Bacillus subtilis]AWK48237.1 N-acetyltransferase [Bacillus velezensis]AZJ42364.1 GNAT family N-acetyltransferase [Bacillus velezensis]MBO3652571.1 GNAT family N-acetyltransferase [Bacillus amyloliquefaciens]MBW7978975.1 GNAT family N-acetyltransferase [Bacillus velezensis]
MYIRRLTANDTQPYSDIRLKALKDHPDAFAVSYDEEKEWPSEKFKARLEADNAIVLGAFEQDRLIGILKISKHPLFKLRHIAVIGSMYISPKHRGSGAGKALMTEAISRAKKMKDTEQLHLSVTSTNEPAKKLYAQLGFILFSTEKRALKLDYQQYVDVDQMVLFLS